MEFKSAKRTLNIKITRAGAGEPLMVLVAYSERK
jgi:hypothetical protein